MLGLRVVVDPRIREDLEWRFSRDTKRRKITGITGDSIFFCDLL
jgi:hypothetical protein